MGFSVRLKALRAQAKETQEQVARATNISVKQLQRFEYGEQKPGFDDLGALADHFHVTVDYLLGRTDGNKYEV